LEELKKPKKILSGTARIPVEIRTEHFPNMNLLRYNYKSPMGKNGFGLKKRKGL
jgi:hypothetical protein